MNQKIREMMSELQRDAAGTDFDPISEITDILSAIPDRTLFLNRLLTTGRRCFMADHGAILSHHRPTGRWFLEAAYALGPDAIEDIRGLSWTVVDRTSAHARSLLIADATAHELTRDSKSVRAYNILSVLTAPIMDANGLWGIIYLDNASVPNAFDEKSQQQLSRFAQFAGIAIQRCEDFVRLARPIRPAEAQTAGMAPACYEFASPVMIETMEVIRRAARTEVPILLTGETGTGKDFLTRWIHQQSARRQAQLAQINCANIPPNLVESELFGIESRVATGVGFQEGRLKLADGGTVFLNEIGELPLSIQAKILRVIEEKVVDRIGGKTPVGVDVRFICATNRDLGAMLECGEFRRDLYFRINIFEARIPPLRERPEDIPALASYILNDKCRQYHRSPMRIPKTTMAQLTTLPWKGNIRELANVIERGVILSEGDELHIGQEAPLPTGLRLHAGPGPHRVRLPDALDRFEVQMISQALRDSGWMLRHAAHQLGLPVSTLRSKISKHGVKKPRRLR
ncbi:MAG: sigma-54-dependent Fis family transcriptional regulator [candidate division Zixibacteria bacterium]|nr:sigma-54-dependent Fis family transcriptional regulator [candidate division Zixibacteria bacterium]